MNACLESREEKKLSYILKLFEYSTKSGTED